MEDDFDDLAYHRDTVSILVTSGFFNEDDLEDYLADLALDPDGAPHAAAVADHARAQFAAKRTAEAGWPAVTDCDRLDGAFAALETDGILGLHNAGMTTSDAHADAWELIGRDPPGTWLGFAYYHGQDIERVVAGNPLFIGFDAVAEGRAAKSTVGEAIMGALHGAGFAPEWNGDPETRLQVPGIVWQRRTNWVRPALPPQAEAGNSIWRRIFG